MKLYNSLSKQIEPFSTVKPGEVLMYVCGVTPYETSHLGHAFVFMVFDALVRFLTHQGYKVNYTQNVTDIDDPLIERANKLGVTEAALAAQWTEYLLTDFKFLNIAMPTHYVKASDELAQMCTIIRGLIAKGYGYESGGNVYFDIAKFPSYGSLSGYSPEEMLTISAERGNDITDKNKRNPLDFILWRQPKANEPSWDSPWGKGRPGWHIECTAMSTKYLGQQIDIHGGGADLLFPHHESEIAQAESYSGASPFVKYWMHVAMVYHEGIKMSKSKGNIVWVRDLAKDHSANAIRYYLLSHHYRSEWSHDGALMNECARKIAEVEKKIAGVELGDYNLDTSEGIKALENDFDVPKALEVMYQTNDVREAKKLFDVLGFITNY